MGCESSLMGCNRKFSSNSPGKMIILFSKTVNNKKINPVTKRRVIFKKWKLKKRAIWILKIDNEPMKRWDLSTCQSLKTSVPKHITVWITSKFVLKFNLNKKADNRKKGVRERERETRVNGNGSKHKHSVSPSSSSATDHHHSLLCFALSPSSSPLHHHSFFFPFPKTFFRYSFSLLFQFHSIVTLNVHIFKLKLT